MSSGEEQDSVKEGDEVVSFVEFLEGIPPSSIVRVSGMTRFGWVDREQGNWLQRPEIQIFCSSDSCNGVRFHRCTDKGGIAVKSEYKFVYLNYVCSNCRSNTKTYALAIKLDAEGEFCYKFGEFPVYGPPVPPKMVKLIGPDRELLLKGRRCENQGLGIGAFVYYRRVVENQKNRILGEIIKVSHKLGLDDEKISLLTAAKDETQFSKALSSVKDAIPQALLINGHNPLTLLHSALSDGLHDRSDEHCLEIASSVRVVLAELSERISQALKDEVELNNALSRLMAIKANK